NPFHQASLLPDTLRNSGYATVFALDESRFANLDDTFGFDHLIMAPPGIIEFVAGTMYDTAGTNLLQLVPGMWRLMPHTAGNRALSESYLPSVYNARIKNAIRTATPDKPLFLVAHFCIAHVPFAPGPLHHESLSAEYADSPAAYRKAVSIASLQVDKTLNAL